MRKVLAISATFGLFFHVGFAFADVDLFKKSNCMACHAVEKTVFGPSLKAVAAKYAGDSSASVMLAKKIQVGGAGAWGQLPMPPQPQVSDADAKTLTEYILSIK